MICDKCNNYEQSPDGCNEKCNAIFDIPFIKLNVEKEYIQERFNGNKNNCKYFERLKNEH